MREVNEMIAIISGIVRSGYIPFERDFHSTSRINWFLIVHRMGDHRPSETSPHRIECQNVAAAINNNQSIARRQQNCIELCRNAPSESLERMHSNLCDDISVHWMVARCLSINFKDFGYAKSSLYVCVWVIKNPSFRSEWSCACVCVCVNIIITRSHSKWTMSDDWWVTINCILSNAFRYTRWSDAAKRKLFFLFWSLSSLSLSIWKCQSLRVECSSSVINVV